MTPSRLFSWFVCGTLLLLGSASAQAQPAVAPAKKSAAATPTKTVRLMTIGLALCSTMTALSGLSRNGFPLAAARIGVGVGEATASPSAYSLISDWFPKRQRATALAIYSAGIYFGGGFSLFLGGAIVDWWNAAYPVDPPFGLVDVFAATIPTLDFTPAVHVNYAETVLPMRDGLPKLRDFPAELGGSGETIAE